MKPAGQPEQAGLGKEPKSRVKCMLVRKFLCSVNDTRALIGLCLLVTSHLGEIRDPWHSQPFTITHIVIAVLLHIHSFIHLRVYLPLMRSTACRRGRPCPPWSPARSACQRSWAATGSPPGSGSYSGCYWWTSQCACFPGEPRETIITSLVIVIMILMIIIIIMMMMMELLRMLLVDVTMCMLSWWT